MTLTRVYHVWQLDQGSISELEGVVRGLGSILGSSGDENSAIVSLDGAESNWNVEVDVKDFPLLALVIDVVESNKFLIELEEVDLVRLGHVHFLFFIFLRRFLDSSDCEIIGHSKLRVPVETNVLCGLFVQVGQPPRLTFRPISTIVRGSVAVLPLNELIEKQLVDFDVAVVHNQILSEEVFQIVAIDDLKFTVLLEPVHHLINSSFELAPILLEGLNFGLCDTEVLVELLEVVVDIDLLVVLISGDLLKLTCDFFGELGSFLRK